jgi:flagellar FliJ protein
MYFDAIRVKNTINIKLDCTEVKLKKFQFRLQVVLDIKEKLLEEKLLELSKVQRGLQEAIEKQKTLESYQLEINQALLRVFQSGNDLDLIEVQRYKDFINKLIVDISNQKVVVQNINKLLQVKRKEVNEVLKEKKVLEKLKENQQKKFYQEYANYESRELDDISSSRYARRA